MQYETIRMPPQERRTTVVIMQPNWLFTRNNAAASDTENIQSVTRQIRQLREVKIVLDLKGNTTAMKRLKVMMVMLSCEARKESKNPYGRKIGYPPLTSHKTYVMNTRTNERRSAMAKLKTAKLNGCLRRFSRIRKTSSSILRTRPARIATRNR